MGAQRESDSTVLAVVGPLESAPHAPAATQTPLSDTTRGRVSSLHSRRAPGIYGLVPIDSRGDV
jgi:hypothetical protein